MVQGTSGQALVSQRPRGGSVGSQHPPGTVAGMGLGMGLGVWQWQCRGDAMGLSFCVQRRTAPVGEREPLQALDTGQRQCPARCLALPAVIPADNLSLQLDQIQLSAISELASCLCLASQKTQDCSLLPIPTPALQQSARELHLHGHPGHHTGVRGRVSAPSFCACGSFSHLAVVPLGIRWKRSLRREMELPESLLPSCLLSQCKARLICHLEMWLWHFMAHLAMSPGATTEGASSPL